MSAREHLGKILSELEGQAVRVSMVDGEMYDLEIKSAAHVHDAGTFDVATRTGGAHGTVRLDEQLRRSENTEWGHACMELLAEAK